MLFYDQFQRQIIKLEMNNNLILQNLIQNGNSTDNKYKKSQRQNNNDLQLLIATTFNQVCELFEQNDIPIDLPQDCNKLSDKIACFKIIIEQLIANRPVNENRLDQSGVITCKDCQAYEGNIQKLQGEVRQHIRLQQQLKIYQESQEEKIQQNKKERKDLQKKVENVKKQMEDLKHLNASLTQKNNKMQGDVEGLKKQNKELKKGMNNTNHELSTKRQNRESRQSNRNPGYTNYQCKENKIDWVHRNVSIKKDDKDKNYERKSIEKKHQSTQKWRHSNTKSTKMISIMNQKLMHQKTKEERKKAIQSKFDYRR